MSTPATFSPFFLLLGRSRTWPMLASTLKPDPRYLLIVFAFDGDSTMTTSTPFLLNESSAGAFRVRRAGALEAATERLEGVFFRVFEVAAGASAEVFFRAGTGHSSVASTRASRDCSCCCCATLGRLATISILANHALHP